MATYLLEMEITRETTRKEVMDFLQELKNLKHITKSQIKRASAIIIHTRLSLQTFNQKVDDLKVNLKFEMDKGYEKKLTYLNFYIDVEAKNSRLNFNSSGGFVKRRGKVSGCYKTLTYSKDFDNTKEFYHMLLSII